MEDKKLLQFIQEVTEQMPEGWLSITTHRLDIYNEELAKVDFLEALEALYKQGISNTNALNQLPTAYDYIRLGHPLSCVLEWGMAQLNHINAKNIISFSSKTIPIMAILRKNLLSKVNTRICYTDALPKTFDAEILREIYGYNFEVQKVSSQEDILPFEGSTILISAPEHIGAIDFHDKVDFYIHTLGHLGSILVVNKKENEQYVSEIQHVRRRETIAMTPANTMQALNFLTNQTKVSKPPKDESKTKVTHCIQEITGVQTKALVASSGLSIQYAITMGLIHEAMENQPGKPIKIVVPPNCYGGTNDQARRVAACNELVDVVDLPVDGENDMVQSLDRILSEIAEEDAIAYIIAEIPTNPRVEVPDLNQLEKVLNMKRTTSKGNQAVDPVFILDQTFCPNYHFLGEGKILSKGRHLSFASGSKFPSGGKCTAGYCIGNNQTKDIVDKIELHLELCENEATDLQYQILAEQLPSMNQRIKEAYTNTRYFVNFISEVLPEANINFVSEELASQGFTPSVFSLDLPAKGNTKAEIEAHRRSLNLKLIHSMIEQIPSESKFCVSYGQLKGCYWTVPATSTQGTTKEDDKDYIIRASLSPNLDLAKHKKVFLEFVNELDRS